MSLSEERFPVWAGWLAGLLLFIPRLRFLHGPLDDPHSWRQCDSVFYSLDLWKRGLDVLHPHVSWLGAHGTLILEFPATETLAALLYRWQGPDPFYDRVVSLVFFAIATLYLYGIVARFAPRRAAWFAAFAYLAFPLSQFFSRAAQPDFAAAALAHAFLFHTAAALERRSTGHTLMAIAVGSLAAVIKAPVLVPVIMPLLLVLLVSGDSGTMILFLLSVGLPVAVFALWRRYVDAVNGLAPDWSFLPGYYKEVNPLWWYLGSATQRLDPDGWHRIAHRLLREAATPAGALAAAVGLIAGRPRDREVADPRYFALLWGAGFALYVFIFFNLNLVHNYYQIPALGPLAMLIGLSVDGLMGRLPRWLPIGPLLFLVFIGWCLTAPRSLGYYRVDWLRVEAGREIAARVPVGDLVVASDGGSAYSDPRLLVRANRVGWAMRLGDLSPSRVDTLATLGARWVAVVTDPGHAGLEAPAFLERARTDRIPITHDGQSIGTLHLYRLSPPEPQRAPAGRKARARGAGSAAAR